MAAMSVPQVHQMLQIIAIITSAQKLFFSRLVHGYLFLLSLLHVLTL